MISKTQARKLRKIQRNDNLSQSAGLSTTLSTYEGRRFLWGFLAECGVFQNPFGDSAEKTAFRCGMQASGQRMLEKIITASPEAWLTMQRENAEYEASRAIVETEMPDDLEE